MRIPRVLWGREKGLLKGGLWEVKFPNFLNFPWAGLEILITRPLRKEGGNLLGLA